MKLINFPLLFFLFAVTLFPQSKKDSLVSAGNRESFMFNFDVAETTFQNLIKAYPESPLGYYYIARNSLWIYLANKDSLHRAKYLHYSELAEMKAEQQSDKFPDSYRAAYNLGNVKFLQSVFSTSEQKTMDAFWAVKKAVSCYEDALELNQNYYAPYLPLGIVKYALGYVPGFLKWAISLASVSGSQREGIKYLIEAFNKCDACKTEAAYHLGKAYTEYNAMYDSAETYLAQIVKEYPDNELFLYQYAILLIDKRELSKAEKILDKIILNKHYKFKQTYALSFFLKGEIYFKRNRFTDAITEYKEFILHAISFDYTGLANLKIALAYEMLKDKHEAQHYYLLARNGNKNIPEDEYAAEESRKLFDKNFTENDRLLIKAKNLLESGKYSEAIKTSGEITGMPDNGELSFNASVIQIEAYQRKGEWQKSHVIIDKNLSDDAIENYKNYVEFLYLTANQYYMENNFSEAKKMLDDAFDIIETKNNKLKRLLINLTEKIKKRD